MKHDLYTLLFSVLILWASAAHAQVDPSSAILLRSGGSAPTKGELDSGRYSIRPSTSSTVKIESNTEAQQSAAGQSVNQTTKIQIGGEAEVERREPSKSNQSNVTKIEINEPEEIKATPPAAPAPAPVPPPSQGGFVDELRALVLGGSSEEVDEYLGKVEASDPRNNVLEFTLAPMLFYNDSRSNYWYRDYYSYGPGVHFNARAWLSPFFGISTTYQTSFNSEVRSSHLDESTEPVDHETFGAELLFRSYFGVTRKAPSLTFGLGFSEYQMRAKSDSTARIGVKTSGFKMSLDAVIPETKGKAWTLGVDLMPRASHREARTQISPQSGSHDESTALGLSLGRRYTFSRSQTMFWKLHHTFEKNAFKNQANQPDPLGHQPSGVSVTNTRSMFIFGFTLGN